MTGFRNPLPLATLLVSSPRMSPDVGNSLCLWNESGLCVMYLVAFSQSQWPPKHSIKDFKVRTKFQSKLQNLAKHSNILFKTSCSQRYLFGEAGMKHDIHHVQIVPRLADNLFPLDLSWRKYPKFSQMPFGQRREIKLQRESKSNWMTHARQMKRNRMRRWPWRLAPRFQWLVARPARPLQWRVPSWLLSWWTKPTSAALSPLLPPLLVPL